MSKRMILPAWAPGFHTPGDIVSHNGRVWQYASEQSMDDAAPDKSTHWKELSGAKIYLMGMDDGREIPVVDDSEYAALLRKYAALAAELATVKAQLARYTTVTREQFGYQEGLDNTIAMACYGEYLRRLSSKENDVPKCG